MPRILAFAGSARRESLNKKLARVAAQYAREAGAEVTFIDLDDYPMPVYHGDLEAAEGMPENGKKLRALFLAHDALLIVTPENNRSIPSLLKNTIDWLSRSIGDGRGAMSGLAPYRGKVAALERAKGALEFDGNVTLQAVGHNSVSKHKAAILQCASRCLMRAAGFDPP